MSNVLKSQDEMAHFYSPKKAFKSEKLKLNILIFKYFLPVLNIAEFFCHRGDKDLTLFLAHIGPKEN